MHEALNWSRQKARDDTGFSVSYDVVDPNGLELTPWPSAGVRPPSTWYVVRDLGAALGETGKVYPRRNWLDGFEREAFITAVEPRIEFDYGGATRICSR